MSAEYILVCSCFRMDKKADASFSALFPDKRTPEIVKGGDRIFKLAKATGNDHIMALSKLSGRFAYYLRLEEGNVAEEWDLQRGRRIA